MNYIRPSDSSNQQLEEHYVPKSFLTFLISPSSLLRLGCSVLLAAAVLIFLSYVSYINYWKKTIFRTQTVDFNMLVNIMPAKLSQQLLTGNTEELQRILDSNYGLFGLVVTNCKTTEPECPGQEITYISSGKVIKTATGKNTYQAKGSYAPGWQAQMSEESLKGQLYELLRNPPPLTPGWEFKSPRDLQTTPTGRTNSGEIIGRVYFLRNPPPSFFNELKRWLKNPLSSSSTNLLYNSIGLSTLFTSLLVWLLLESRYHKASLAEQRAARAEKVVLLNRAQKAEAESLALAADKARVEAENRALAAENIRAEVENQVLAADNAKVEAEKLVLAAEKAKIDADKAKIDAENRALAAENRELSAKNEALRYRALWDGFQESFDQDFASVLANRLEELRGFFRRLDTDIDNIVHDMRKAPLLGVQIDTRSQITEKLRQHFHTLSDAEKGEVIDRLIKFICSTDDTIRSIDWVLKDLREVANIDADQIQVQSEVESFLHNQPPYVKQDWLDIEFKDKATRPLWVLCNAWHLRSIIKNVLYNCTAALSSYQTDQFILGNDDFQGKISITCFVEGETACISITDNGPGYPATILDRLYQSPERVNKNSLGGRGSLIVYSYLQLHYGKAQLENLPTGGGKVTFSFPLASSPSLEQKGESDSKSFSARA